VSTYRSGYPAWHSRRVVRSPIPPPHAGVGGDRRDTRSLLKEGSVAVLFNPRWAVGVEYREKPDNLSFAGESDWADLFVGYFPNKQDVLAGRIRWAPDQTL